MTPPSTTRRDFLGLLSVAGVPLIAAGALRSWESRWDGQDAVFDQATLDKLTSRRAEIALIGNSMVFQRIDTRVFDDKVAPLRSMMLAKGGWRSLAWLLSLKNLAAACTPPPRLAVVVFRDYDFANPKLNVERRYLTEIRSMIRPGDEPLLEMARGNESGPDWRARVEDMLVPDSAVSVVRGKLNEFAFDCASSMADEGAVRTRVDQVFDLDQLRPEILDGGGAAADIADGQNSRFSSSADENFLSRFVETARAMHTSLIFYRVKRRPGSDSVLLQSPTMQIHMAAFKAWAEGQGCILLDEADDPAITLDMFRDGDHLHEAVRPRYTELFLNRIRPYLPAPFTPDDIRAARAASAP